ncbi:MAG: sigma-70 family RNA polymerase sigma factor [Acidobacteria bacterium]|nr:sigma-70 family RNA polymerase sigma factor [Acidobacteriota bacterium]
MSHPSEIAPEARILRDCAQDPDELVWRQFLATHGARLRLEVRGALLRAGTFPSRERCEDLEQEVLCRLLERERRALASFRGRTAGEASAYLRRIAARVVADDLRAAASPRRGPARPGRFVELPEDDNRALRDRRGCPESRALAREEGRLFLRRCRDLMGRAATPARLRVVSLAFVGGLSSDAIAARMGDGWSRAAVDSLLHRIRRKLEAAGGPAPGRRGGPPRER